MTLSDEARSRLADVVSLQPTKNAELAERWEMEGGSEVHRYLEGELREYYYRDENSLIRATPEAAELVGVDPGLEDDEGRTIVRVPEFQVQIFSVLPGPDERSQSVVATLQDLREEYGIDPEAKEVRSALQSLRRKGVVEIVYRTVPTFRRATEDVTVEESE